MSDSRPATVGVVGDDALAAALEGDGHPVAAGDSDAIPSTDVVVAVGQSAVAAVATADGEATVLPVEAGRGVRSVPHAAVGDALDALGDHRIESHPILAVEGPTESVTGIWDVTLVTADAARISEFSVSTPADAVGTFRADGVAIATPAGSPGYLRRIGGPILAPDSVAAVAPIAPFATNPDHWVLPLDSLAVSVDRDEATVSLVVDGTLAGSVECGKSVTATQAGTWQAAVVPQSRSRFA